MRIISYICRFCYLNTQKNHHLGLLNLRWRCSVCISFERQSRCQKSSCLSEYHWDSLENFSETKGRSQTIRKPIIVQEMIWCAIYANFIISLGHFWFKHSILIAYKADVFVFADSLQFLYDQISISRRFHLWSDIAKSSFYFLSSCFFPLSLWLIISYWYFLSIKSNVLYASSASYWWQEDILYRLNMIYEYADELDDLTQEINLKLDKLIEKAEKKNHDSSSDHDSPIQF